MTSAATALHPSAKNPPICCHGRGIKIRPLTRARLTREATQAVWVDNSPLARIFPNREAVVLESPPVLASASVLPIVLLAATLGVDAAARFPVLSSLRSERVAIAHLTSVHRSPRERRPAARGAVEAFVRLRFACVLSSCRTSRSTVRFGSGPLRVRQAILCQPKTSHQRGPESIRRHQTLCHRKIHPHPSRTGVSSCGDERVEISLRQRRRRQL